VVSNDRCTPNERESVSKEKIVNPITRVNPNMRSGAIVNEVPKRAELHEQEINKQAM
jgi:hypothetical protein